MSAAYFPGRPSRTAPNIMSLAPERVGPQALVWRRRVAELLGILKVPDPERLVEVAQPRSRHRVQRVVDGPHLGEEIPVADLSASETTQTSLALAQH